MKAYVLVEGPADANFVKRLLPPSVQALTAVTSAGARSNLTSIARTLLVTKRKPLAILVDADSLDEPAILQRRREIEELIRAVSGGVPFRVFMMVPEFEALLFRVPAALERIGGCQLTPESLALAQIKPGQALARFGGPGQGKSAIIEQVADALTDEELESLRSTLPIRELIEFLGHEVMRQNQAQSA